MAAHKSKLPNQRLKEALILFRRKSLEEKLDLASTTEDLVEQYCLAMSTKKGVRIAFATSPVPIHANVALMLINDSEPEVLLGLLNKQISNKVRGKLYPKVAKLLGVEIEHIASRWDKEAIVSLLRTVIASNADFRNNRFQRNLLR